MTEKLRGQIRHLLTALGGVLIAAGVVTETEAATFVNAGLELAGAAAVVAGMVWSWIAKA